MTKKKSQNTASAAKQPSPPPQRSRWPFVILAIVLVAAVAAAILLLQSAKQPAIGASTATSAPAGTGRPQLVVDQEQIDFGSVPVNKMVKASFKLTNAGDTPLTLSVPPVAQVVEGC